VRDTIPQGMSTARNTHLFLHLSNRLESLAERLADDLSAIRADPLTPHAIVVSSAETARWLSMHIADRCGLAMGLHFPFLRGMVDELATAMLGGQRRCSARYGRDSLTWWLYDRLPEFMGVDGFGVVAAYLRGGTEQRRFELARRVASLFDQYQVYRPQMLRDWDSDTAAGNWQGHLWRALRRDLAGEESFVDLHAAVVGLADSTLEAVPLPGQLGVFGLSTLPPAFLDVLHKAALRTRIDFYVLSPTDQYWGDLMTEKQRLRASDAAALRQGNPLANSFGKLGRDLLDQLLACEVQQASETFSPSSAHGLLGRLQDDLLELRDRTQETNRDSIDDEDRSIEVHSCHSPLREIEVLHDHLLRLFQDDGSLQPRDVLVMAPNIEAYAPYIRAVFGTPESETARIAYSLADQSSRTRIEVVDVFLRILELGLSNFGSARVLAVLESEVIRERFGLTDLDLERIHRWIDDSGIVQGLDAAHRARLGLPESTEFSWAHGEATWIFGYAMNSEGQRLYEELLPCIEMEADHLDTLDRLLSVIDFLRGVAQSIRTPKSRRQWSRTLLQWVQQLFGPETKFAADLRILRDALSALSDSDPQQRDELVPAEVVIDSLDHRLHETPVSGGFLDGRITFCSLKPMRAIPARIICLLGMNERDFPRQGGRPSFDLLAIDPRRGDRSLRDDDRYLFLEALLSARDALLISHVGQSQRDTSTAPPSGVVTEMLDYLARSFSRESNRANQLVVQHKLQTFNRRYFELGPEQSFSKDNAAAATALSSGAARARRLFLQPLPEADDDWRRLSPAKLVDFFVHPARRLCEWRLGIRVGREAAPLRSHEPLELDHLQSYNLQQERFDSLLKDDGVPVFDLARARGRLPTGAFGAVAQTTIDQTVYGFLETVRSHLAGAPRTRRPLSWSDGRWSITGELDGIYAARLYRFRSAKLKSKDIVAAWVEHLLLNLTEPGMQTVLIDRNSEIRIFRPPESVQRTEALLQDLLAIYWRGLTVPLPFFPDASGAYARSMLGPKGGKPEVALRAAERAWMGNEQFGIAGELDNPWNALVFAEASPLDDEFTTLALDFFRPVTEHLDGKLP